MKVLEKDLLDSDQLEFDLWRGVPWGGRPPRYLTRGFSALFLRQEPPCHEVELDPLQLEMWPIEGCH